MEWTKEQYNKQYETWVPWIEDMYLRYFTKDNKASYTTRENLNQTKVTGVSQVDTLQDGVNNLVAGQVGQGGLAQPVGDMASREGMNRVERNGKDNKGSYIPDAAAQNVPGAKQADGVVAGVAQGAGQAAGGVQEGLKSVGGGLFGIGGGKK
ncbi:hypothetical protein B0T17DRAFT_508437 [Bombardia bombarda]|uniref:Uncharacterized protein n=1 Tax=Bombardia bombarda TaxID=252184 RepID=A0AA40C5W6_9PEZI|nr:hypothetical protein B0T17DRAFT_508437 [Bombardia bombarda]